MNGSANQQTFMYDAFGNRKDAARAASASVCIGNTNCEMAAPVETTNTNHLTAATYDDAGNVTVLDGTYNYSYDALNMVKSTAGREYVYTADDERIATVSGGAWTWTIRSPGRQVLSEFTSSGTNGASSWTWTRDHIWRGASLLAVEEKNASGQTVTRHFHLDHLGTPRLITNGSGQQIGLHSYYPFGTELLSSTTEAPADNIKFTGHEWDDLGGDIHALTYMHARYYSAALGRFLSVDPTVDGVDPGRPQSWNRYAYVRNNPTGATDPTGRILEFSGREDALDLLTNSLNADLGEAATFSIDTKGIASLTVNTGVKATKEQQAMISMLSGAISDLNVTRIAVAMNDPGQFMGKSVEGGQMSMDIGDMAAAVGSCATTPGALAAHEIAEKWAMQSFGKSRDDAHQYGTFVENRIAPWQRPIGGEKHTTSFDNMHRYDIIFAPYFSNSPYYGGSAPAQWVTFKLIDGKVVSVTP